MKIYIAAPYQLRSDAHTIKAQLTRSGHEVTSRWITDETEESHAMATMDLEDIRACDTLLMLHPEDWHWKGTGGRHVEFGYALALGKDLVILGSRSNNFHHLEHVRTIEFLEQLNVTSPV